MRLKSLTLAYFQSFTDPQKIVFNKGVYCIVGRNKDSGGSNGAGKSSLVRAISASLLGTSYLDISGANIKNKYYPNKKPELELELEIENKNVIIKRIIGGELSFLVNGHLISGKVQDTQNALLRMIRLNADQLLFLTYKNQFSAANFLYMKDSERKDFLINFFSSINFEKCYEKSQSSSKLKKLELHNKQIGLKEFEVKVQLLETEISSIHKKIEQFDYSKLKNLENELIQLVNTIKEKELALQSLQELPLIKKAYEEYLEAQNSLQNKINDLQIEKQKISNKINDLQKEIPTTTLDINSYENSVLSLEKELKNTEHLKNDIYRQLLKVESDLENIKKNIEQHKTHLQNDKCPVCTQQIPLHILSEMQGQKNNEINNLENAKINLENLKVKLSAEYQTLEIQLENLKQKKSQALLDLSQAKALINNINAHPARIALLQAQSELEKIDLQIQNCLNGQVSLKKEVETKIEHYKQLELSELQKLKSNVKFIINTINLHKEELQSLKTNLALKAQDVYKAKKQLEETKKDIKIIEREIQIFESASQVFHKNGFISFVFDNLLKNISVRVNNLVKLIPIVSHLKVEILPFNDEGMAKKDRVICIKIYDNLGQDVSIDSLSGAERQTLALLIDTAIDDVLEERLGVSVQYKIYDEQFSWVDAYNKEFILDFLNKHYSHKTLIIIDHSSELNSSIENVIIVEKQNGESKIVSE